MSTGLKPARPPLGSISNLPNQVTSLRLILSVILFALIAREYYVISLVVFIVAAATDWFDGYYARKHGQITTLGRILDPFADKVIVCGAFIFLANAPGMLADRWALRTWMVVVIVGRELLVTALRSFLEERGSDFSAKMSGKLKMVLQSVAIGAVLVYLELLTRNLQGQYAWVYWFMVVAVWSAVLLTVYSGAIYVWFAYKLLRADNDESEA